MKFLGEWHHRNIGKVRKKHILKENQLLANTGGNVIKGIPSKLKFQGMLVSDWIL